MFKPNFTFTGTPASTIGFGDTAQRMKAPSSRGPLRLLTTSLVLISALVTTGIPAGAAAKEGLQPGREGADLIVMAEPGQLTQVVMQLRDQGAVVGRGLPIINGVAIRSDSSRIDDIERIPGVDSVVIDSVLEPMSTNKSSKSSKSAKSTKPSGRGTTTTTAAPTIAAPTTAAPTTAAPTTAAPTTAAPSSVPTTTPTTVENQAAVTIPVAAPVDPAAAKDDKSKDDKSKDDKDDKSKEEKDDKSDKDDDTDPSTAAADKQDKGASATGSRDPGSLEAIARATGARSLWRRGVTGQGVDVALIDTGISPMPGLPVVINGADLSSDAANPNLRFLDGFGHGTHMAGIIAGKDAGANPLQQNGAFVGIAPDARIVNVKVGGMDGRVHSSQVVAAIDWVVQNRQANGMNIKVINLSYGAPATPNWRRDPLAWASEVAWRKGITVVAAAGNEGAGHELSSPAYSPEILAVGATETEVSRGGKGDYAIAPYTSTGTRRRPDLFVPGGHVISLRTKGSFIDTFLATKNVGERFTRGTGTSQATAVASGLAALLAQAQPTASPDQLKALLVEATDVSGKKRDVTGIEASIDVLDAFKAAKKRLPQVSTSDPFATCGNTWCRGIGDGSAAFVDWAKASWAGNSWTGSSWTGNSWTGSSWTGSSWTGNSWTGSSWTGSSWTQDTWAGSSWTGSSWTGSSWTGSSWTGSSWTGSSWTGSSWSGSSWSGTWDQ